MTTIGELVHSHAGTNPDQAAFVYLDAEMNESVLTYGDLDASARRIAAFLEAESEADRPALIVYPHGLDFVRAFFGCIYAGKIAVPLRPPSARRNLDTFHRVLSDSSADIILSPDELHDRLLRSINGKISVPWVTPHPEETHHRLDGPAKRDQHAVAFLQYTSGSTGSPKGVMVDHASLILNLDFSQRVFGHDGTTVGGSWLPMFHDMGLIGMILGSLHCGATSYLVSPEDFIRNPLLWLRMISKYRVETTATPNFGFEHCVNSISSGSDLDLDLDLSTLSTAIVGAEPVRHETLLAFWERFAAWGLRPDIFFPSYGMAEATLYISSARFDVRNPGKAFRFVKADMDVGVATVASGDEVEHSYACVPHGDPSPDVEIRIVDPETREVVADGEVGEIWVTAAHVATGYWRNPDATGKTFGNADPSGGLGSFLRTGDLGFYIDGAFYISGRLKDLLIIRGVNHFPQDIESTVEQASDGIQPFGVAVIAFAEVPERIVVVAELRRERIREERFAELRSTITKSVSDVHGVRASQIEFTRPYALPKTTSGKIRRSETARMILSGELPLIGAEAPNRAFRAPAIPDISQVEPTGESEGLASWIADWVEQRLDLEELDLDASIASVGIDSITSIELAASLSKRIGSEVDPTYLWTEPSVRSLSARLLSGSNLGGKPTQFVEDAQLADGITIANSPRLGSVDVPDSIFLTGATGFLGAYLLADLIASSNADVTVLVRADDASSGFERLRQSARTYGLPERLPEERIHVFAGDLGVDEFGSHSEYDRIREVASTVVHSAALVDFTLSYPAFRDSTIMGTNRVLQLCASGRSKQLHHVSSVAVFESEALHGTVVDESTEPIPHEGIRMGYSQAKWASERLAIAARKAGLPVTIYRPSLISGDSVSGAWSESDFLIRLLVGCVEMKAFALFDFDLDATPVDYVSRAIILSLLDRHASASGSGEVSRALPHTIHLNSSDSTPWESIGEALIECGLDVELLEYREWRARFNEIAAVSYDNVLFPFRSFFLEGDGVSIPQLYRREVRPRVDRSHSVEYLSKIGVPDPPSFTHLLKQSYAPHLRGLVHKRKDTTVDMAKRS